MCRVEGPASKREGAAEAELVEARMAFCRGGQVLSMTQSEIEAGTDPLEGRFQTMLTRLTRELFPHRDSHGDDAGPIGVTGMLF
jgi:hypothetical protein